MRTAPRHFPSRDTRTPTLAGSTAARAAVGASVNDVEGVSQRPVELGARDLIEMSDGMIIKVFKRNGQHVVAIDRPRFREPFVDTNLDLGTDSSNRSSDRRARDRGQHSDRRIASEHANGASTRRRAKVSPEDVVARYHAGAVRAASRAADRLSAASAGCRR